ncbi:unnamed protein product, partial [Amoebophrya sp. A25]|eukprot:GSA25T00004101001.1
MSSESPLDHSSYNSETEKGNMTFKVENEYETSSSA